MNNDIVREWHGNAVGIAGALAAGAAAARAASADRQWAQHQARIDGRRRVIAAKESKNQALRRQLAALNALAALK